MQVREGYKQTEVGVIPEDWNVKRLGDVLHVRHGKSQHHIVANNGQYPILATGGEIGRTNAYLYDKPSVLIGRKGTIDKPRYQDTPFWTVDTLFYTELSNAANPKFIYFKFQMIDWRSYNEASGVPSLNASTIENIEISIPDYAEQHAIASTLSDVDMLLAAQDKLFAKKRNIKQAAMQLLLTGKQRLPGFTGEWGMKQLGDIAEIVMGQSPSSSNYNVKGLGLPLIQGNADISDRKTIRRIFTTEITKRGKCGDILMSVRAPVGEISLAAFDVCLGRGVCAIRYANDYLYHYLISQEPSWARLSKGSTFDSVNSADVNALEVCLPNDVDEQTAIATILSDMDADLTALEQQRDKTRAIKQGMMQELLTGRIRLV